MWPSTTYKVGSQLEHHITRQFGYLKVTKFSDALNLVMLCQAKLAHTNFSDFVYMSIDIRNQSYVQHVLNLVMKPKVLNFSVNLVTLSCRQYSTQLANTHGPIATKAIPLHNKARYRTNACKQRVPHSFNQQFLPMQILHLSSSV